MSPRTEVPDAQSGSSRGLCQSRQDAWQAPQRRVVFSPLLAGPEPGRTTGRAGVVPTVVTSAVQVAVRAQTEPHASRTRVVKGPATGTWR